MADKNMPNILPQSSENLKSLQESIFKCIEQFKNELQNQLDQKQILTINEKIKILEQRIFLIEKCSQFSLRRLEHLQQIFKHYCTHIFKTGKYMTFQRLEYEKVHLTMDRFFLFLRDFNLLTTEVNGKTRELVQKNAAITIFKKVSSTARDLSFEEFIQCLEKIGITYYDEKEGYDQKIQNQKKEKARKKLQFEKNKLRRMKLNKIPIDNQDFKKVTKQIQKINQQNKSDNQSENIKVKDKDQVEQKESIQEKQEIQPIKYDKKSIKEPKKEIKSKLLSEQKMKKNMQNINKIQQNNQQDQSNDQFAIQNKNQDNLKQKQQISQSDGQDDQNQKDFKQTKENLKQNNKLLRLTNNQKIQYFYQLINVDSQTNFKNKLTDLNLIQKQLNERKIKPSLKILENSIPKITKNEEERLLKIKQKMMEKKQKQKNIPIPKPSNDKALKQVEASKKRRQLKKQREEKLKHSKAQIQAIQLKKIETSNKQPVKKSKQVDFNIAEVNWNMLGKVSIDEMKIKQFNPNKYYTNSDDDMIFMEQFGSVKYGKIASNIQAKQRQSLSVVQNAKKRVNQLKKNEQQQKHNIEKRMVNKKY